jgi:threonylcarbamoyl-AMP synthase-like protein
MGLAMPPGAAMTPYTMRESFIRSRPDTLDIDLIVAERVPDQGLGAAILDRLQRASHDSDT